jgi:hypothetical protein
MSAGPVTIRQSYVTTALRAVERARKAGLPVSGFEVRPDGSIVVLTGERGAAPQPTDPFVEGIRDVTSKARNGRRSRT